MNDYKDLHVWQRSRELVRMMYPLINKLPRDEKFILVDQMKRALHSIPSNIAEGQGRGTKKDFIRFLYISFGSACELESQLISCVDLGFFSKEEALPPYRLIVRIRMMLQRLIDSQSKSQGVQEETVIYGADDEMQEEEADFKTLP